MNPGSRPRKGAVFVLASLVAAAVVGGALVVGTPDRAEASGLEAFTSCAEMSAWASSSAAMAAGGDEAQAERFSEVGASVDDAAAGAPAATTTAAADQLARTDGFEAVGGAPVSANAQAGSARSSRQDAGDTGATNLIVEGVDEFDLIDRLGGDRILVASASRLAIVDLAAGEVLASREVAYDAQISYDPDAGIAWVVGGGSSTSSGVGFTGEVAIDVAPGFRGPAMVHGPASSGVRVERIAVGASALDAEGSWESEGMLVAARRVGAELHLVASDGFTGIAEDRLPFGGATVPCDEVLHPLGPSEPTASLIATFTARGPVDPVRATQVVGSGQNVHVTLDAAYLATPQWEGEIARTGIHRFDLATLTHTGSGRVDGTLLNDFSISEHDGHLRVAVTAGGGGFIGMPVPMPMPVEPDVFEPDMDGFRDGDGDVPTADGGAAVAPDDEATDPSDEAVPEPVEPTETTVPADVQDDVAGATTEGGGEAGATGSSVAEPNAGSSGEVPAVSTSVPAPAPGEPDPSPTEPVPPVEPVEPPETTVPETTVPEPTVPETTVPETTVPETTVPDPVEPEPQPGPGDPLNQVVVLDIDGDLDVVGRTPRFGKPGETIHGVRFDGDIAYAVTFLQTDPFYVLDLSDPTDPTIEGEVELPGFSSYLHPVGDGMVVGFGPGGDGRATAKLFDVTDRTAPRVADDLVLGHDSPVSSDHHAFVDLGGGRFAVPASSWRSTFPDRCTAELQAEARERSEAIEAELAGPEGTYDLQGARAEALYREMDRLYAEGCLYPGSTSDSSVVVIEVRGDRLVEVERITTNLGEPASRVMEADGGWALLAGPSIAVMEGDALRTTIALLG